MFGFYFKSEFKSDGFVYRRDCIKRISELKQRKKEKRETYVMEMKTKVMGEGKKVEALKCLLHYCLVTCWAP